MAPRGVHRDRNEKLRELRHLLREVFESKAEADAWLHTSLRGVRGRTPVSHLRQGDLDSVIGILATVESGAFT